MANYLIIKSQAELAQWQSTSLAMKRAKIIAPKGLRSRTFVLLFFYSLLCSMYGRMRAYYFGNFLILFDAFTFLNKEDIGPMANEISAQNQPLYYADF